ncbi:MAG: EAL domain-containing protein [Methylotenera sp.]
MLCFAGNAFSASEVVTLQLKWHHQFQFAGYYAALNQGYYQAENLDVRILEGGTDAPALNQVLSGAANYGIGDSDILLARTQGRPVVAIASVFQHSPYVLLSMRDSKIQQPADLIGKRIMLSNNQGATQFKAMMNKQGISLDQVTVLPHSWNLQDLIDGKVDAMSAYATAEPAQLDDMGYSYSVLSNQQYGVDYYGDTLFTTEREVDKHPERVDAFLRATKKGWAYAFSHQQETAAMIAKMQGVAERGITEEMLLTEARLMQPYVLSDVVEFGHMNLERWNAIANSMAELHLIPENYTLQGFIYNSNVFEQRVLRWVGGLLISALLLMSLIFLWNLQIRRKVKARTAELQEEVQRRHQAENLLKIAGSAAKLGGWIMDVQSGIVTWSDEVAAIHDMPAGYSPTVEEGIALFVPEDREKIKTAVQNCIAHGIAYDLELEKFTASGRRIWVRTIGKPVRDVDGVIFQLQGSFQDISERKSLEAFKVGQSRILEQIASNRPLMEIMHAAVALIEAQFPDCMCSTMLMDSDGRHLHVGASTKLPQAYLQCIDGVEISSHCGSCGTAAYEKRCVIVTDIAQDPLWADYKSAALPFGLHACWSSPIFSSQKEVLGTFAVYHATAHTPTKDELEFAEACSHILGIAIERSQAQAHLRLLESGLARLNDIVMITETVADDSRQQRIIFVNDAFETVTGYSRDEVLGQSPDLLDGQNTQSEELLKIYQALTNQLPVHAELIQYKKSADEIWLELDIVPVPDQSGWHTKWVAVMRDITQRKQSDLKIQQLAFYDTMTGLPNRQLLTDRLEQRLVASVRNKQSGAVLFIDLDNFKSLNDTHGHDVGDMLLMEVARRLQNCVRGSDTVSRLGGDEFVVIIDKLDENPDEATLQVRVVCEKILRSFEAPFVLNHYTHHSTPSIGVTLFGQDATTTVDELLRRADLAMYKAKDSGRNAYRFFDPEMEAFLRERVVLEADLHQGILEQQFVLHFQPQYDSARQIVGAEALIRWQHPQRGLVMPAQFSQFAEDSGLILTIGEWVLTSACRQLLLWAHQPETKHLSLSVNVSPRQYLQSNFVEQLTQLIKATGIDPSKLKLELTESILVENVEEIISKMNALSAMGVGFSLDDFGTGYSSLSYLKRLPLGQLKIDQSFVCDIFNDDKDSSIVHTIINLGQNLGLQVLAEGVETEEQLNFLLARGCQLFQGYLFSKPVPVKAFEALLIGKIMHETKAKS